MGYGTGSGIGGIIISGATGFIELALVVIAVVVAFALALNKFKKIK